MEPLQAFFLGALASCQIADQFAARAAWLSQARHSRSARGQAK